MTEFLQQKPEERLFSTVAKIPNLQYRSHCLFTQTPDLSEKDVENLVTMAKSLDREVSVWEQTVPNRWSYSASTNVGVPGDLQYVPNQVHRYHSFYAARVWNFYRVARLIILSVLIRAATWLSKSMETQPFMRSSTELVNAICASVPFLLGDDLSRMRLPATTGTRQQDPFVETAGPARHARFSLIWPLHVGSSSTSIPEAQRDWMRGQLQVLAKYGEAQAHVAFSSKSQILLGGADDVRYDCV